MASGDEVVSPSSGQSASARPTLDALLAWIAAEEGRPWFPSRHAATTGADRDALDEPLSQLRVAGLIRVAEWERGLGQGYVLTREGEAVLARGAPPARLPESKAVDALEAPTIRRPPPIPLDYRRPIVVPLLIVANLLWFFVGLVMVLRAGLPVWPYLSEGYAGILHKTGAVNGFDLFRGEWWRLATSCFVHIGGAHLLLNLFALVVIGPLAEELWGRARFIIIYVLSGLAGGCLAMALSPESMLAGASGAIWGLLTSLVAWLMLFGRTLDPVEAAESKRRLAVVIVLNAMFSLVPGVSWQGHLGGGIAGFVVAVLLNAIGTGDRPRRVLALALLAAFAVGTVGGLLSAMRWHQAWAGYRQLLAHERTTEEMRLALEKTKQAIQEAGEAYDRDVAPLLMELSPEKSKVAMGLASNQLIKMGDRRNKARVAEARVRLTELKRIADTVIELLTVAPVGVDVIDRHRQRARAFAAARSRSVALVLAMLDSPDIPDASAWAEWEKAKSEADALWPQLAR